VVDCEMCALLVVKIPLRPYSYSLRPSSMAACTHIYAHCVIYLTMVDESIEELKHYHCNKLISSIAVANAYGWYSHPIPY
jgi:hypothetical protein